MVKDFYAWLKEKYGEAEARRRYAIWKATERNKVEDEEETKKGGQQTLA